MNTLSDIARNYDEVASNYDQIVGGNGWPANDLLRGELGKWPRVDHVLDLGAGTGLTTEAVLGATVPRCLAAVDVSARMLEQLRNRCRAAPELIVVHAEVGQFLARTRANIVSTAIRSHIRNRNNYRPGSAGRRRVDQLGGGLQCGFDLVTAIGLFQFLPEPAPLIAEVVRVLRSGGRFIFTYDPFIPGHPTNGERQTTYDNGLTAHRNAPEDIGETLLSSGLQVVSDELFVPQPHGNTAYRCRFVVAAH